MSVYRIDDLARLAGTTVRNVRSYQEKGLLPAPVRQGRSAHYSEKHLARLRTIGTLLARGYGLSSISELIVGWESGKDIDELLGLEEALTSPFSDEEPTILNAQEIALIWGETDLDLLARAVAAGFFTLQADGTFHVPSLRLLRAGAALRNAGIEPRALFDEFVHLRAEVERLAARFVRLVADRVVAPHLQNLEASPERTSAQRIGSVHELADLVRSLRPLAKRVVDAELSRALDVHARALLGDHLVDASHGKRPTNDAT